MDANSSTSSLYDYYNPDANPIRSASPIHSTVSGPAMGFFSQVPHLAAFYVKAGG